MNNHSSQPVLAAPGAGLPFPESVIAPLLVGLKARLGTRGAFERRFQAERELVRQLLQSCPEGKENTRVLVARGRGMEDSSRFWSLWMVLDHLRIVHSNVAGLMQSLGAGELTTKTVSTADVKPSADVAAEVVLAYEGSCDALLASVAAIPDLKSTPRHVHPWFGPINAHQWFALMSHHIVIHRKQMQRILAGL